MEDLATALAAQKRRRLEKAAEPVTFAGYDGLYMEFSNPANLDIEECFGGNFDVWHSTAYRYQLPPGSLDRVWILDVKGHRLVVTAVHVPGESPEFEVEMAQMLESITIGEG